MEYVVSAVVGYILGSLPTAYILLKRKGIDITKRGSGNVGAFNSLEVSKSKLTGLIVFAVDFTKGLLSVLTVKFLLGNQFEYQITALLFAVFSHCYSPWIKFKGGKGLATGAGGTIILMPVILGLWIILWIFVYLYKKNIQVANSAASGLVALLALFTSGILNKYSNPPAANNNFFGWMTLILFIVILTKHIIPLKEYFLEQQNISRKKHEHI